PEHRIADLQVVDAGSHGADHARKVASQNMRELDAAGAVGAASEPHFVIGGIDAGGVDVDDDLARPGRRVMDLGHVQYLRPAMFLEQYCLHRPLLLLLMPQKLDQQLADASRLLLLHPMTGAVDQVTPDHPGARTLLHPLEIAGTLVRPPVARS